MSDLISRSYGLYQPDAVQPQRASLLQQPTNPILQPLTSVGGSALRTLAGALEPLQLPKDVMDAMVAGALDPDTTMKERLGTIEWAKYAPWGATPIDPASGQEILGFLGVENEFAKRAGGFVYDLAVDPLVFGTALTSLGRVGNLVTKTDDFADLVKLGQKIDGIWDVTKVGQYTPKPVRQFLESNMESFWKSKVFWNSSSESATYADLLLSRRVALAKKFDNPDARGFADITSLAEQKAVDFRKEIVDELGDLHGMMLPEQTDKFLGNMFGLFRQKASAASGVGKGFKTMTREAIYTNAYELTQRRGILFDDVGDALNDAASIAKVSDDFTSLPRQAFNFSDDLERIRKVAIKAGDDPDLAVESFKKIVAKTTEIDARIGLELSGYNYVKERVTKRMGELGLSDTDATQVWQEALQHGVNGDWNSFLAKQSNIALDNAEAAAIKARREAYKQAKDVFPKQEARQMARDAVDLPTPEGLRRDILDNRVKKGNLTYGEIFGELDDTAATLKLPTYLKSLNEGHMRRVYGMFQDNQTFDRWVNSVKSGKMMPTNIIDEKSMLPELANRGFSQESTLIDDFIQNTASSNKEQGQLMNKFAVIDHLIENGVPPSRAKKALTELIQIANPELDTLGAKLANIGSQYDTKPNFTNGSFGRSFVKQREELETEVLNQLGELANPLLSLLESSQSARSNMPMMEFLNSTYDLASKNGFASATPAAGLVKLDNSKNVWGAYAGKYVHPQMKQELLRTMKNKQTGNSFDRVRSLITGGYLSKPSVMVANYFGGLYTSALMGINPFKMAADTMEVAYGIEKQGLDYPELAELRSLIAIDETGIGLSEFANMMTDLGQDLAALKADNMGNVFDAVTKKWGDFLQKPFGVGMLGLEGFSKTETFLKTAAYKTQKARYLSEGMDLTKAMAEAAEDARLAVFDYSELPELLRTTRDYGLTMFPGFTYFLTARTANTALKTPGRLSVPDRLSEAMSDLLVGEDVKYQVYASMPEWMREEQGMVYASREDKNGDGITKVLPFNQIVPTSTFWGQPWAESAFTGGIWKPFLEIGHATMVSGTGEAPFSAQFGGRVFEQGASLPEKAFQTLNFAINSLAPGSVRAIAGYTPGRGFDKGIVPALMRDIRGPVGNTIYSLNELQRLKPDKSTMDELMGATVRSVQPIQTSGPLANIRKEYASAQFGLRDELMSLQNKLERASLAGNTARAQKIAQQIASKKKDFQLEWQERMRIARGKQ